MILFLSHSGIKIYTLLFYVIVKLYDMFQGHIKCNKNKNGEAKYCESTVFLWIVYWMIDFGFGQHSYDFF